MRGDVQLVKMHCLVKIHWPELQTGAEMWNLGLVRQAVKSSLGLNQGFKYEKLRIQNK